MKKTWKKNIITFNEYMDSTDRPQLWPYYFDTATREAIEAWFGNRYIYVPTFHTQFNRIANRDYKRYKELFRIDIGQMDYDWLITQYEELQRTGDSIENSKNGGISNTDSYNEGSNYGNVNSNSHQDNRVDNYTDNVALTKSNPMSISYSRYLLPVDVTSSEVGSNNHTMSVTTTVGQGEQPGIGRLDWTNPSTQNETMNRYSESDITDGKAGQSTSSNNEARSEQSSNNDNAQGIERASLDRQIRTGRNDNIAYLIQQARDLIYGTSAWEWLQARLEVLFIGIYDPDNIDEYTLIEESEEENA